MHLRLGVALGVGLFLLGGPALARGDTARWEREAARVVIVRDDWGIAHVHGVSDADAVFGMIYAQAEDDFARVETNYITSLGRLAEVEEEGAIWHDLRQRLIVDPADLRARYAQSPAWLKALMDAWADGLNDYLATHPKVRPRLIARFEPWMALSFSEGSIGGDIESVSLPGLEAFYGRPSPAPAPPDTAEKTPTGSNGIAIAPMRSATGHALLLINPHTSFYFRSEAQVSSDEGLDAYGAATWGQFFVYQGFNAHAGWMMTSSNADAIDEYAETIVSRAGRLSYRYGTEERPLRATPITIAWRTRTGALARRTFTIWRTGHGPIVRQAASKWISVAMMDRPVEALEQSFLRTKAKSYASFLKVARLRANSSNNTVFADDRGEIAYLHPQFIPRRDDRFDFSAPVDGADPATDWKGMHDLDEIPHVVDPRSGWIFNTNDAPWAAAGPDSPRRSDYPRYMETKGENARGLHAALLLARGGAFTPQRLIATAYDPYLPAFARLVPIVVEAWRQLSPSDPLKARLAGPIALLKGWDDRWAAGSTATSLAVFWGERLRAAVGPIPAEERAPMPEYLATHSTARQKLETLSGAVDTLTRDFGDWRVPWGEINRFQRLDDDVAPTFDDLAPSIAVPFTSSAWGSLAAFETRPAKGGAVRYGVSGNSFVAVVEFGAKVHAFAVTAGGESGDPASRHFDDQARRYARGDLREVYFYPSQLASHTERRYHPGQ